MPKKSGSTSSKSNNKARRKRGNSPIIQASVNISQISKSQKMRAQSSSGDEFRERTVSARTFSHWKPISKPTQALLVQTIDSAFISVLSGTSSVAYASVQEVLNNLKKRILDKSRHLKVPATKRPKFNTLEVACRKLEAEVLAASSQEDLLSEMVEQMTKTVQDKEKILAQFEKDTNVI